MSKKQMQFVERFKRGLLTLRQKRLEYAVNLLNCLWSYYNGSVELITYHLELFPPPFEIVVDFEDFKVWLA